MSEYEKLLIKLQECKLEITRLSRDNSSLGAVTNYKAIEAINSVILMIVEYMENFPREN